MQESLGCEARQRGFKWAWEPVQLGVVNNNWRTTIFFKGVAENFSLARKENPIGRENLLATLVDQFCLLKQMTYESF